MNAWIPFATIAVAVVLDATWWAVADRSVRRAGGGTLSRALVALFAVGQATWAVLYAFRPGLDLHPLALSAVDLAGLAWHLVIVPITLAAAGIAGLVRGRRARRTRTRAGTGIA